MPSIHVLPRSAPSALVTVVLPCYNEESVLRQTHSRLTRALRPGLRTTYEILYVDDGSTDGTWSLIEEFVAASDSVRGLRLSRNFGHQAGCLAGLREAAGDAVVIIDADLQDPPELITEMVARWWGGWSVVSGRRTERQGEGALKKASAFAYYRVLNAIADHPVALDTGDFRLLDRPVVDLLTEMGEHELFLRGAISWAGLPETTVEYRRDPRAGGESKYTVRKMLELSQRGIVSGSSLPIRATSAVGLASMATAAGLGLAGRAPGAARSAWSVGLLAVAIGVLGEYVNATLRHVQGRPPYVVRDRIRRPQAAAAPQALLLGATR
ncbi:glycosyltransferase family 2 protein [Streptomyces sp. BE20]|uniref:glycosyltransferase family 2 protein n=1 Tax=unclassified Streptomyces TaxID=2593676 RepID=UPI002E76BEF5|nr:MULTISPECIES: glycosyltransferase family 2 protein [unclassified Streptomyces]MED7950208.1 glycosyltransferase family 2 protein [Streptomyces sp. BE303]MEE1822165.1 glycosyltransferase family 2 protein [Streptomyces sp. BE20]